MGKQNNLTDFLTDLADGIRAKKGTTSPINPQNFRREIESIEGNANIIYVSTEADLPSDSADGTIAIVGTP